MNKPIVVFGGSFNPPTNAHFSLAEQIVNDYDIDTLLFVPVGDHYPKPGLIPGHHRVNMLRDECFLYPRFAVSTVEVDSPTLLTTFDTLQILEKRYHTRDIWFVMGADNLRDFPNWNDYETILDWYKVFVIQRGNEEPVTETIANHPVLSRYQHNIIVMNQEIETNCSSTLVRRRIQDRKGIRYIVPASVCTYVERHHLYQDATAR